MKYQELINRTEELPHSLEELQILFLEIATDIMKNHKVKKNNELYQLTEIEFYFFSPKFKIDFIHDKNEGEETPQRFPNIWYHHYSGLDITFGNMKFEENGGILIRGIKKMSNQKYFSGPLKVCNELFGGITIGSNFNLDLITDKNADSIFRTRRK